MLYKFFAFSAALVYSITVGGRLLVKYHPDRRKEGIMKHTEHNAAAYAATVAWMDEQRDAARAAVDGATVARAARFVPVNADAVARADAARAVKVARDAAVMERAAVDAPRAARFDAIAAGAFAAAVAIRTVYCTAVAVKQAESPLYSLRCGGYGIMHALAGYITAAGLADGATVDAVAAVDAARAVYDGASRDTNGVAVDALSDAIAAAIDAGLADGVTVDAETYFADVFPASVRAAGATIARARRVHGKAAGAVEVVARDADGEQDVYIPAVYDVYTVEEYDALRAAIAAAACAVNPTAARYLRLRLCGLSQVQAAARLRLPLRTVQRIAARLREQRDAILTAAR